VGLRPAQQVYCRGWSRVYLEARGEVYLGVELETIYLGASKGGEAATVTCNLYLCYIHSFLPFTPFRYYGTNPESINN